MADLALTELTTGTLDGTGVFDKLMQAHKAHLEAEYKLGRIKGAEYATVYLGSLDTVMQGSMNFLIQGKKVELEKLLLEQQLLLAQVEVLKANVTLEILAATKTKMAAEVLQTEAQTRLIEQQRTNLVDALQTEALQRTKLTNDILQVQAQTAVTTQQKLNLQDELLTAAAQRTKLDSENLQVQAQTAVTTQQKLNLIDELVTAGVQRAQITQQTANLLLESQRLESEVLQGAQKILSMQAEVLHTQAQTDLIGQQKINMVKELDKTTAEIAHLAVQNTQVAAQTAMITEQVESEAFRNFVHPSDPTLSGTLEKERQVLIATQCKLTAEYDLLLNSNLKTTAELQLMNQKILTEKAQVTALGVDADSVVGRQKSLYQAQTDGFTRDAEQKVAKMMIDTWNARRMTDEATAAGEVSPGVNNRLGDIDVGKAVTKMFAGVNVT